MYSSRDTSPHKTLIIIDNSLSMTVQDIARDDGAGFVSRLDAAKAVASQVMRQSNGEVAIVSFAREPLLEMPFSQDMPLAESILHNISPLIYGGGSDVFAALEMASHIYGHIPHINILVFTDAEFFHTPDHIPTLPTSDRIAFVGIGTER